MDKFFFKSIKLSKTFALKIALVNHLYRVLRIINGLYTLFLLDIFKAYESNFFSEKLLWGGGKEKFFKNKYLFYTNIYRIFDITIKLLI